MITAFKTDICRYARSGIRKREIVMEIVQTDYSVEQNLENAGCTKEYIKHYMSLQGSGKEQLNILEDYRDELVKQMHDVQRKLDCLDYLLFYKRTEV